MKKISISILPNLITLGNLFFGFWAILTMLGPKNYPLAALFIFIAAVLDAMDGKVARFVQSDSKYGLELDSLADVISFGVAPSVLVYAVYFQHVGHSHFWIHGLGVGISFMPLLFGALRLARYNILSLKSGRKNHFLGLPIPVSAVTLAGYVMFNYEMWDRLVYGQLLIPLVFLLSYLMVSSIPYQTMPRLSVRGGRTNSLKLVMLVLVVTALVSLKSLALFPIALGFIFLGIFNHVRSILAHDDAEDDDVYNDAAF